MTDNEIIKALKICTSSSNGCSHSNYTCDDCYLKGQPMCSAVLHQDTIDLINRQQAEIEQWKVEANRWQNATIIDLKDEEEIKADAIKEFANDIINNILPKIMYGHNEKALEISLAISKRTKEMVGEQE